MLTLNVKKEAKFESQKGNNDQDFAAEPQVL